MSQEDFTNEPMADEEDDDQIMDEDDEDDDDVVIVEENCAEVAENMKEQGNSFYKNKQYREAAECYTNAINKCPQEAAYYGNRAAAYMMLCKYREALDDARQSVQIDPTFAKGYVREGKCLLILGDIAAAIVAFDRALNLEPTNATAQSERSVAQIVQVNEEKAGKSFNTGDFRAAGFYIGKCLDTCPASPHYKIRRAEAFALCGKYQESQELVNDIIRFDSTNADAIYVRGVCLYYQDNVDVAFQHFQQVLRLSPDHHKAKVIYKKAKRLIAKKEEGNTAFKSGRLREAKDLYSEALEIDDNNKFTNSKLYFNRATVCSKLGDNEQAVNDCSKAIELDDRYLKAYLRRAKCYMDIEKYDESVRDYEKICQIDGSRENKQLLKNAKLELKKSKRKDLYKTLGVGKDATDDEIKKAYRKRALIHHPDRHSGADESKKKEEEVKFKEVGEAYSVLSDKKKKMRYDQGVELEDLDGGGFGGQFDASELFSTIFGNAGGQTFSSGFGGGGGGGGFPGGFHFQFQ